MAGLLSHYQTQDRSGPYQLSGGGGAEGGVGGGRWRIKVIYSHGCYGNEDSLVQCATMNSESSRPFHRV